MPNFPSSTDLKQCVDRSTVQGVTAPKHGLQGQPLMSANIVAFNRQKNGRIKYTLIVRFEEQEWSVHKYYTDFLRLRNELETSQFNGAAHNLPRKHPLRLLVRMKLSLSRRNGLRKEMRFIQYRMKLLTNWTTALLSTVGPSGLFHVRFLDDFFQAFPDEESYHRTAPRPGHVIVEKSMFHALKIMSVSDDVYQRLWDDGYCFDSISKLTPQQWLRFGVSQVVSAALFHKFRKYKAHTTLAQHSRYSSESSLMTIPSPTPGSGHAATFHESYSFVTTNARNEQQAKTQCMQHQTSTTSLNPPPYTHALPLRTNLATLYQVCAGKPTSSMTVGSALLQRRQAPTIKGRIYPESRCNVNRTHAEAIIAPSAPPMHTTSRTKVAVQCILPAIIRTPIESNGADGVTRDISVGGTTTSVTNNNANSSYNAAMLSVLNHPNFGRQQTQPRPMVAFGATGNQNLLNISKSPSQTRDAFDVHNRQQQASDACAQQC